MKNFKKIAALAMTVVIMGATGITSFASMRYTTNTQIDAEKLEEYRKERLEAKKEYLEKKVSEGVITEERADAILENLEENGFFCYNLHSDRSECLNSDYICNGEGWGDGSGHCGVGRAVNGQSNWQGRGRCHR